VQCRVSGEITAFYLSVSYIFVLGFMFTTCGYGKNKTQYHHKFCIFSRSAKIWPSEI